MTKKFLKSAVTIRGDCLYCPLPLAVDSYWNCLVNCPHCYFRRLNHVWGKELRPSRPEDVRKKLVNGMKNKNPKSSLAYALSLKKTIRVGNKTDPYQPIERKYKVTRGILKVLIDLRWTFAIQTRFLHNLLRDEDLLTKAHRKGLLTLIPIISPGLDKDQQILERGTTTPISMRCEILKKWVSKGWNIGVNGEPFIPGYHTIKDFHKAIKLVKSTGVKSYNTYNFHFNDYVAKRLHAIGIDIMAIWKMNQDRNWSKIQKQLCKVAKQEGIILGCPDFVNTTPGWKERTNTCCGVNVPNPCKFNSHWWKRHLQKGLTFKEIMKNTWEGIGDIEVGKKILKGEPCSFYTMREARMLK